MLNRFYTTPICSPTRALMTGRDPIRLGVAYGVILPWHNNGIHPDERFLPGVIQGGGIPDRHGGKMASRPRQMTYRPNNRGFEYFYGHLHRGGLLPAIRQPGRQGLSAQWRFHRR